MDDWSHLPSRHALAEPAPNPQSTMNTDTLPARLTRPRQAPHNGADLPNAQHPTLDPTGLARQQVNQSGAKPRTPRPGAPPLPKRQSSPNRLEPSLDNTRPFMDDIDGMCQAVAVSVLAGV